MKLNELPKVKKEEKEEKSNVTLFNLLYKIFTKSKKHKYEGNVIKKNPTYLIGLWLSHENNLIKIINKITKTNISIPSNIKEKIIFDYFIYKVPKSRNKFIKYAKKIKKNLKREKEIENLKEQNPLMSRKEIVNLLNFKERLNEN